MLLRTRVNRLLLFNIMMNAVVSSALQQSLRRIARQQSAATTSHCTRLYATTTTAASSFHSETTDYARPVVQWYPGHIAKAERALSETLKAVDVVVEIRDARIPKATSHPMVAQWTAGKPRIIVLTRSDAVPGTAKAEWTTALDEFGTDDPLNQVLDLQVRNQARQAQNERLKYMTATDDSNNKNGDYSESSQSNILLFVNAKEGVGVKTLNRRIIQAGVHVQERRSRRGLLERPLRVGIIGYPNTGKSTLVNKLIGRKRAKTANTPGVTRSLQWIRVRTDQKQSFELLDSPGIIPATLLDQSDATLLAACNCIGDAAYDNQAVASFLCDWLLNMHRHEDKQLARQYAPQWRKKCLERYKFDPLSLTTRVDASGALRTGEDLLFDVADATCQGNPEDASRKILQDFRAGRMGPICLQVAPTCIEDGGQRKISGASGGLSGQDARIERQEQDMEDERMERAKLAQEAAKQQGLVLPPIVQQEKGSSMDDSLIGKGVFDGW
ncbi:hypothetical protein MPSEU_000758100 [Mayamaea pseudoterrestris]|nr:hypothetical protein MPSEU_000758100 [Mayamaea pseudoterrestris]